MVEAGHTIICGLEGLGLRVAEALLRLDEQVTIVSSHPGIQQLHRAQNAGAKIVRGETSELLELPGIDLTKVRCLVLTENADLANLHIAMAARDLNPNIQLVIRIFNDSLAKRAGHLLPKSRTISASREAVPDFVAAALDLAPTPTRLVWGRHFAVDEAEGDLALPVGSSRTRRLLEAIPRRGRSNRESIKLGDEQLLIPMDPPSQFPTRQRPKRFRRLNQARSILLSLFLDLRLIFIMLLVSILFGLTTALFQGLGNLTWAESLLRSTTAALGNTDPAIGPNWFKVYEAGFMFANAGILAAFFALIADAVVGSRLMEALDMPRHRMRDHAVVIGLGTVGYRISRRLLEAGIEVIALDSRPQNHFIQLAKQLGISVLVGDARFRGNLHQLSLKSARVVLAVTDNDLVNLEVSLMTKELNPQIKVVARLFDPTLADLAQRQLGIDFCHSVSTLAAPAFVAASIGEGVLSTLERGGRLWLLAQQTIQAGSATEGLSIKELERPGDIQVLATRSNGGESWNPNRERPLEGGDSLLVACSRNSWSRMKSLAA